MSDSIVPINNNITALLDQWLEAERNGEQFPVPLHDHWNIAGHRKNQDTFALVESVLERDIDFLRSTVKTKGRPKTAMFLSVAGLEHLCMAAHTEQGKAVRELYRQAKAKWDLTKQTAPQIANEVEMMHMKIELAKIEAQKEFAIAQAKQADLQLVQFRHTIVSTAPEYVQQKVLGFSVVEKVEYRDRIVNNSGNILDDGSTVTKKELCQRLGFIAKGGSPDYKRLNLYLDKLPHTAFDTVAYVQENRQLRRDWIANLEAMIRDSDRQYWLGEN